MVRTHQLTFSYPGQPATVFPDMDIPDGSHALILGPSGVGKTTFLHLLGGLLSPSSGDIHMAGTALHSLRGKALDRFRGDKIGIVFQRHHFIRSLTALENLLLTQYVAGQKQDVVVAKNLLDQLGIGHHADRPPHRMSIGEQQRLAIARAVINHPAVILADEPSSALDDDHCRDVIELLLQVANQNKATLLVVTHDQRIKDIIPHHIHLRR